MDGFRNAFDFRVSTERVRALMLFCFILQYFPFLIWNIVILFPSLPLPLST